nr:VLF-1 [Menippe mercenaria nudivirus]
MASQSTKRLTKSEQSHFNLLKNKSVNIEKLKNKEVKDVLNTLRTTKNKVPSQNYLISILRTLRKLNADITKKPTHLGLHSERNTEDEAVALQIKKSIVHIIKDVYNLPVVLINGIELRSTVDTYISVLLVTSTSILIKDVYKLTKSEYQDLCDKPSITKSSKIMKNKLFPTAESIIDSLLKRRDELDRASDRPILNNKVVSCTTNTINKTIKKLCQESTVSLNTDLQATNSLGLSSFKFTNPNFLTKLITP